MSHRSTFESFTWAGFTFLAVVTSLMFLKTLHENEPTCRSLPNLDLTHLGPSSDGTSPSSIKANLVAMSVEETVHYNQFTASGQVEWPYTRPQGSGNLRLGPRHQLYALSAFHQLHCIEIFSNAITGNKNEDRHHLQHCLNYMREMALCRPDLTLEPGDFTQRNFTTDRVGATHICRNWEPEYEAAAKNWQEWIQSQKSNAQTESRT